MRAPFFLIRVCKYRYGYCCPRAAEFTGSHQQQPQPVSCFATVANCSAAETLDTNCNAKELDSLLQLHRAGEIIASESLLSALNILVEAKSKEISVCRKVHALMISVGFSLNTVDLNRACISLFGHSSRLFDANLLFASLEDPNPLIWHAIISVHATVEEQRFALFIYFQMMEKGMKPNKSLHLCALKACSYPDALGHGRLIHSYLLRDGKESGVVVGTILLNFYAACGNFDDAQNIFTRLPNKNIVSWGAFIAGCAQHRKDHLALELYEEMQNMGLAPDADVLSSVLKACSGIKDLLQGLLIHDKVIRQSVEGNIVIGNTLIDMYAKCGDLVDAQQVFDTLPKKTAVTWSSMLAGVVAELQMAYKTR